MKKIITLITLLIITFTNCYSQALSFNTSFEIDDSLIADNEVIIYLNMGSSYSSYKGKKTLKELVDYINNDTTSIVRFVKNKDGFTSIYLRNQETLKYGKDLVYFEIIGNGFGVVEYYLRKHIKKAQ